MDLGYGKVKGCPGPGTYEPLTAITPTGKHAYSKFENSKAILFSPPRSKRFLDLRKLLITTQIAKEAKIFPGPGQYPLIPTVSSNGVYPISNYRSSKCRKFDREARTIFSRTILNGTPGPGTYKTPSEFGIYDVKEEVSGLSRTQKVYTSNKHRKNKSMVMP